MKSPEEFEPSLMGDMPKVAVRSYDDHTHGYLSAIIIILTVMLWRVW